MKNARTAPAASAIKVADEVWIATALLHFESPRAPDFSVAEIMARVAEESITGATRPGLYAHVVEHCVAGRAPSPGRYRMLVETARNRRRLFRAGDSFHPSRRNSKVVPTAGEIPRKYRHLLDWYGAVYAQGASAPGGEDSLLALRGSGKGIWADEHADDYVRRLREGWE